MKVVPSTIAGVSIHAPDSPEFEAGFAEVVGAAPRELLEPAIPFSVIVANRGSRSIPFLGVRFDMLSPGAKQYSVVHYADSLRNPEKSDFRPGCQRFVCAEPEYTTLVIRGGVAPNTRGRMNLDNLRRMMRMESRLDCVAFEDGEFQGPDSRGAFDRLAHDRQVEQEFIDSLLAASGNPTRNDLQRVLYKAVENPRERAARGVARKLLEALQAGGPDELRNRAGNWRYRIALWKAHSRSQT